MNKQQLFLRMSWGVAQEGQKGQKLKNSARRSRFEEQHNARIGPKVDLKNTRRPRIEEQRNARRLKAKELHKKAKNKEAM